METSLSLIAAAAALVFGLYLGRIAWIALRSGTAEVAGGKQYRKKKKPLIYWTAVGAQSAFSLMFLIIGAMRLLKITG